MFGQTCEVLYYHLGSELWLGTGASIRHRHLLSSDYVKLNRGCHDLKKNTPEKRYSCEGNKIENY